jgi:Nucleoside recognition.
MNHKIQTLPGLSAFSRDIISTTVPKALKTVWWLLSLMIPISLAVALLQFTGILGWFAQLFNPLFHFLGLPGQCALVFLTSIFLNVYSAIAVISSLSLSMREITIIALMCLISHNMIVETVIQKKTGSSGIKMVLLRLGSSIAGALALNYLLPAETHKAIAHALAAANHPGFWMTMQTWFFGTLYLSLKVMLFVTLLMILQKILEDFGILDVLAKILAPVLKLMGLPRQSAFLWIVANVLGLAYGSAIAVDYLKNNKITRADNDLLNHHTAVSHSLLEDTLLFVTIGVSAWWIMFPRLAIAILIVWFYRLRTHRY